MYTLMIIVFVIGYLGIALEHNIHIDKAASALLTGVITWTLLVIGAQDIFHIDYSWALSDLGAHVADLSKSFQHFLEITPVHETDSVKDIASHYIVHELEHHLVDVASILFFLLGAMTIVELIDAHEGFSVITDRITTSNKIVLLWILAIITFFMSAALDNLTTAIVMAALLKKLIADKQDLWLFAGIVVIAANAGGAWSPIGDVTTIMLWIGGQVTAGNIVAKLLLPSLVCLIVPLLIVSFTQKGQIQKPAEDSGMGHGHAPTSSFERNLVFFLGVGCLLGVPIFKTLTHLPPFMGILLGLGIMWVVTELLHGSKNREEKTSLSVLGVLRKIDTPSVLFFLGILVAVAALQTAGHLTQLAKMLENSVGNLYFINVIIGLLSSIVDNVPLVAGAMGMYNIGPEMAGIAYPQDHPFWTFLAYCAGTGGSCLIIGSAAGVAIMGIMKIDFMWYLKRISLLALAGYLAGAAVFVLMN